MGAWGPALFSDDLAADIREEYRTLVGDGHSGPEATDALLRDYSATLSDPEEGPVFWLALAATQWRCGRLEPRVRDRALEIIAGGTDLRRWDGDARLRRARAAVLEKLRCRLESAQPAEKRIPRRFRNTCDWQTGELIAYHLRSGRLAVLRVIGHHTDKGGTYPICELLDWSGERPPSALRALWLPVRRGGIPAHRVTQFMLIQARQGDLPAGRVQRLGLKSRPAQRPGWYTWALWRQLDDFLGDTFGVS